MGRELKYIWVIDGTLKADTPLAIGAMGELGGADLVVARNGEGKLYAPGTSLAGVLRALLQELGDDPKRASLFGYVEENLEKPRGKNEGSQGQASFIQVADAPLENAKIELRDNIGINRQTGTAHDRLKFVREVVAAGATLPLQVVVEDDGQHDVAATVGGLVQTLQKRGLTLGAASARGLGRLSTGEIHAYRLDLGKRDHLMAWWQHRAGEESVSWPKDALQKNLQGKVKGKETWKIRIRWQALGPLLVKAGVDGAETDMVPLLSRKDGKWRPVLPGSSVRGALRSHAERIVRSLAVVHHGKIPDEFRKEKHHEALSAVEITRTLFGSARASDSKEPMRGALRIQDCFHRVQLAAPPWELQNTQWTSDFLPRTRVAIDRWTGGALDSALFEILEPQDHSGWDNLELEVDFSLGGFKGQEDKHLALLYLVIRDFARGQIPLGYGVNQGYGSVKVSSVEWESPDGKAVLLDENMKPSDKKLWDSWLNAWQAAWSTQWKK